MAWAKRAHTYVKIGNETHLAVSASVLRNFRPYLFHVPEKGARPAQGEAFEALAAVFDLAGFSTFCDRADPQYQAVPFLRQFIEWLYAVILTRSTKQPTNDGAFMWSRLPVWEKFTGDGMLLLWDVSDEGTYKGNEEIGNLVVMLFQICEAYRTVFCPLVGDRSWQDVPGVLRCGAARGRVYPIGPDLTGYSINMASRLQKLRDHRFVCSRRGIENDCFKEEYLRLFRQDEIELVGFADKHKVLIGI